MMFVCFKRRHYNKSPLSFFENYLNWKENYPELAKTLEDNIAAFVDEYPVENAHSILTRSSRVTDTAAMLITRMKDIFANKETQRSFLDTFGHETESTFSRGEMRRSKLKAAKHLVKLFTRISSRDTEVFTREISGKVNWKMPLLFQENLVDIRVLPLGFHTVRPPQMNLACDHQDCQDPTDTSSPWSINEGCGHSYHSSCHPSNIPCPICQKFIKDTSKSVCEVAKSAIVNGSDLESFSTDGDDSDESDSINVTPLDENNCQQEIQKLNDSIRRLTPPTLTTPPKDISSEQDKIKKNPHCRTCSHSTKGHKKTGDTKSCSDCPDQLCTELGRSTICSCKWHKANNPTRPTTATGESNSSASPACQLTRSNPSSTASTVPASSRQHGPSASIIPAGTSRLFLLDSAICQSQVNGRNDSGSSACTTISVLMSKLNLMNLIPAVIENNRISQAFVAVFKVAMTEGNKLQDKLEGQLNKKELCVYEVLRHSNLGLKIEHEDVFTQNNIDAMKDKIKSIVEEKKTAACVVVLPKEVSVSVLFNADGSAIIADSHSHNPHGGLVIYFPSTSSTHVVSCLNWILVKYFNGSLFGEGCQTELTRLVRK